MTTTVDFADILKRVRDDDLAALEAYRKGQGEAPTLYQCSTDAVRAATASEPLQFVANEESLDRMGDIVKVDGWVLTEFKRNPVLMWSHDYRTPPLGTWSNVRVDGKQLVSTANFDANDPFAAFVEGKYRARILRAVSVGFRALEFEEREVKEGERRGYLFTKAELLEISAVAIPAHPRALRKGMALLESAPAYVFMPGDRPGEFKAVTPDTPVARQKPELRDMAGMKEAVRDMTDAMSAMRTAVQKMRANMGDMEESAALEMTATATTTTTATTGSVVIVSTGGDSPPAAGRAALPESPPPDGGQGDEAGISAVIAALRRVREGS